MEKYRCTGTGIEEVYRGRAREVHREREGKGEKYTWRGEEEIGGVEGERKGETTTSHLAFTPLALNNDLTMPSNPTLSEQDFFF